MLSRSILQYFWPALSNNQSSKLIFGLRFEQLSKTGITVVLESNIYAPILLNLFNLLRKCEKMLDKPHIFISFTQLIY